jgi:hypothetical protein
VASLLERESLLHRHQRCPERARHNRESRRAETAA